MSYSDRKLIDAFKIFFDKLLAPALKSHPSIMVEWKNFSSILSTQPIEYSKLDHYISCLSNHSTSIFSKPFSYQPNSYSQSQKKQTENKYSKKQIFQDSKTQQYTHNKHFRLRQSIPEIAIISEGLSVSPPYQVGETNFRQMSKQKPSDDGKKKLMSSLQVFQTLLSTNQYKLENNYKKNKINNRDHEERKHI